MTKKRTSRNITKFSPPADWPDIDHILSFVAITDPFTTYDMVDTDEPPHLLGYTPPGLITSPRAKAEGLTITWRKDRDSIIDDYKRTKVAPTQLYSFFQKHPTYKRAWSVFQKKKASKRQDNLFLHPCSELTFMHAIALGMREYISEKKPLATADQHSNITKSFRRIHRIAKHYDLFDSRYETEKFWNAFGDLNVQFHIHKSVGKKNQPNRREMDALSVVARCFYARFDQTVPTALLEIAKIFEGYEPSTATVERLCTRVEKASAQEANRVMGIRIGQSFVSPLGGATLSLFMKNKLGIS